MSGSLGVCMARGKVSARRKRIGRTQNEFGLLLSIILLLLIIGSEETALAPTSLTEQAAI